jgi:hypothetical protein
VSSFTHDELVAAAREWARRSRKCSVVVSEIATMASETPDVLGWHSASTHLIECKATRSDFLADRKKIFRRMPELGIGDYRWYFANQGVVKSVDELPASWGLVEMVKGKPKTVRVAARFIEKHKLNETRILLSLLKRIGQDAPAGCSISCYVIKTKNRTTMEVLEQVTA